MLGMTVAHRLRQHGHDVTLIEAAAHLGGLASAWQLGDVVWDRHYHVTMMSDSFNRAILREIGLEDEMRWVVTRTGCLAKGQLYSISNTLEFLKFPALGLVDKLRLAATILIASRTSDWKALEQRSVEDWLVRLSGRSTFNKFWKPLLISKLGNCYHDVSAAFIWATIQRLYAARRSGLKQEMFGYVPGGYAKILERFANVLKESGIDIQLNQRVANIQSDETGVKVTTTGGATMRYDNVVVTAPAPVVPSLCPDLSADEQNKLSSTQYMGVLCASVLLKSPLQGYYVTNLTDPGFPFTGIIEMTALVDPMEMGGKHLVYLPRYLTPDDPYVGYSDEAIEKEFMAGLKKAYPTVVDTDVMAFKISRVKYVMPIQTIEYSKNVLPFSSSCSGVYLVNSSQIINGTLNVNETIALAERAVEGIVEK